AFTLVKNNRREVVRFLKFCVVGVSGTVIDFGLLNLLVRVAGFSEIIANTCSFSTAVVNNFIWNRLWVYPETRGEPFRKQFVQFLVVNMAGWGLNTSILYTGHHWLLGEAGLLAASVATLAALIGVTHFSLALNGAKAIATGVVLFWNFIANRLWTFGHVK
ncbi:MAG TPA: GtrA family protein, partial [Anaerolineae bacterium]|nr:GtrA family protein [Anaerolineae bacterium]